MADNQTMAQMLQAPIEDGEARDWLDKEPPRSILTWNDLFQIHKSILPTLQKPLTYRNEIITFYQKPNEAFNEAWERFKGLLRQCPHHGFSKLHQLDTFYNSLNSNDQDASRFGSRWQFLDKMPQRRQIAASLKDKMTIKINQMMNQMKALVVTTPAQVKAVEEVCVTCGSNHNFTHYPLTQSGNDFPVFHDNIQQFQQTTAVVDTHKAENQAKMTKLSMEWKRLCKINQSPKCKVRVNTEESAVKPETELKNTIECNLYPSDGPGKPNSISMKTVKTLKAQS
ncbi:reverse transcriptase domain-containing protein [Tanacetum coccineum]